MFKGMFKGTAASGPESTPVVRKRSTSKAKDAIKARWDRNKTSEKESKDEEVQGEEVQEDKKFLGKKKFNKLTTRYKNQIYNAVKDDIVQAVMNHLDENAKEDVEQILEILKYVGQKMMGADESNEVEKNKRIIAESGITQGLVQSYINAPKKSTKRQSVLSSFSRQFTLKDLNKLVFKGQDGVVISSYVKRHADEVADTFGPGSERPKIKNVKNTLDSTDMNFAMNIIMAHIEREAFGTVDKNLDKYDLMYDGDRIEMPKTSSSKSRAELVAIYKQELKRPENYEFNPISSSHLNQIIDALSTGQSKNLAALDSVYKMFLDTMINAEYLIEFITVDRADLRDELTKQLHKIDIFLRKQYPRHLTDENTPYCGHSYSYAFGEDELAMDMDDDSGAVFCSKCIDTEIWRQNMLKAIQTMNFSNMPVGSPENKTSLQDYFQSNIIENCRTFIAHIVRKTHESKSEITVFNQLDMETCVIRIDYKMKMLALCFRESMPQFYGKRGFSFFGAQYAWKKTDAEKTVEKESDGDNYYHSDMNTLFHDLITDDSKEDATAAKWMLEASVKKFKHDHPNIKKAVVMTNGAGCFAGTEFTVFLGHLGKLTGVRCVMLLVSEVGCGKSSLDTHFCYANLHCQRMVRQGEGKKDIFCAEHAAKALARGGGLASSESAHVTFFREEVGAGAAKAGSHVGLDKHLMRKFIYSNDNDYLSVSTELHLHKMSFRNNPPDEIVSFKDLLSIQREPLPSNAICTFVKKGEEDDSEVNKKPVQLQLTSDDHLRKASLKEERRAKSTKKKNKVQEAAEKDFNERLRKTRRVSTLYNELKQSYAESDHDTILKAALDALLSAGVTDRKDASLLDTSQYLISSSAFKLYDGSEAQLEKPPRGFALKRESPKVRASSSMIEFAYACQRVGDKAVNPNGSKLFPTTAEEAMRLCGTQEGHAKYHKLFGDELMKVLGYCKFKFTERLSAQQLKAYMSKTGADLRKQLEACREREERNAEKKRVEEEAQIALMEDIIKAWVTQSYDKMPALDDKLKEFKLAMGGNKLEKTGRLIQYFRDHDDMFEKDCGTIDS